MVRVLIAFEPILGKWSKEIRLINSRLHAIVVVADPGVEMASETGLAIEEAISEGAPTQCIAV